jgi:prolyl-tRNA synthetase
MLLTEFFLPVQKEAPSHATLVSHKLMLRSGMISQLSSGLYNWHGLGVMLLNNISSIIRQEMHNIAANEILMPILQPAQLWQESGRYDDYGQEMLRVSDRHDNNLLFGPTNEEVVTDIFRKHITSYKSLPLNLFQISWKFRDEIRPRFGVMRAREFLMKDAYSFDLDLESATKTYKKYFKSYLNIFQRLGLKAVPVRADNGAIGGSLSHEFQIIADNGESEIFYDENLAVQLAKGNFDYDSLKEFYAAADEKHDPKLTKNINLKKSRAIEVGHIFNFGTKYSEMMQAKVQDHTGKPVAINMGSYGIGVSRLVAAIIEANHDDQGMILPESISPFQAIILNLRDRNDKVSEAADKLYQKLREQNITILYDNRKTSAGIKYATADLIGIPTQIIIDENIIEQKEITLKNRRTGKKENIKITNLNKFFQ